MRTSTHPRRYDIRYLMLGVIACSVGAMAVVPAFGQQLRSAAAAAVGGMEAAAGAPVDVVVDANTGLATWVIPQAAIPVPVPAAATAPAAQRAEAFLADFGGVFGVGPENVVVTRESAPDDVGMEHVRFRQVHQGIPVTGGEIQVHLRGGNVVVANGRTLPDLDRVPTTPLVRVEDAEFGALAAIENEAGLHGLEIRRSRLEMFNRGILEEAIYPTRLAWFVEARSFDQWQYVWVDALSGEVLLRFSQLSHARNRRIYDAHSSTTLPGTLVRKEGEGATGDADADYAYVYSGHTYNYFFSQFGRDSYDGKGAVIKSSVHFCSADDCPLDNAFWNGEQMAYGDGLPKADDVDAHELTHAVTQHTADLFYYMQSGAMNEAFSDIFGETVDLVNGAGLDGPTKRWLVGEDLAAGAIRNMMNPTAYNDPGKFSDWQFHCDGADNGGVHTNSGITNHAFALMVDGGSYNGQTVTGIGLIKAGKIQYRALNRYLISSSNFIDNFWALRQACTDLIGSYGITQLNCGDVIRAMKAVEMHQKYPCRPAPWNPPALCSDGNWAINLFKDDFEDPTADKWVETANVHWIYPPGEGGAPEIEFSTSGDTALWGYNIDSVGDSSFQMKRNVKVPAAGARMQWNHSWGFDDDAYLGIYWDGGVVEYNADGAGWVDAAPLYKAGATYTAVVGTLNPLFPRAAFAGDSYGYTATQLNLTSLAGKAVRFRFRIGTDSAGDDFGWFIDDVQIYRCVRCGLENVRLVNESVTTAKMFKACDTLTGGNNFIIFNGGAVEFKAGEAVILDNGFSVRRGAAFRADLMED